jgi:hypothetical protein
MRAEDFYLPQAGSGARGFYRMGGPELIFQELKRCDLKPNHSSLSNAEVKNDWQYTSIASVGCLSSGPTP